MNNKYIYQIQVSLRYIKPKIWRRLLIEPDTTLADLHKIIQTVMGWTNSHLHQFVADETFYSPEDADPISFFSRFRRVNYNRKPVTIEELLVTEKDKIAYEYDFGDGWKHIILLEKILPADEGTSFPVCIEGKRNCPPEDIGGVPGYYHLLEILASGGKEKEEVLDMLDMDYDPEEFAKEWVNELLQSDNYGCLDFVEDW